jgi:hypothetical protein
VREGKDFTASEAAPKKEIKEEGREDKHHCF